MSPRLPNGEFVAGTKNALFAKLLMKGRTIQQVEASDYPDKKTHDHVSIAKVRRQLIAAGKLKAEDSPLRQGGYKKKPVVQFHPETKAYRVHALMQAGKSDDEIIAAGFTKLDLSSTKAQVRRKLAMGKPGTALVVRKTTALKPRKSKANGHAAPVVNGAFPVNIVEVIFHTTDGREIPFFSSADVFPHIYAHAARKILGDGNG